MTEDGIRQADVIWTSPDRLREMDETGDPPTRAPEICVEADGQVRFFRDEEIERSDLPPDFPVQI